MLEGRYTRMLYSTGSHHLHGRADIHCVGPHIRCSARRRRAPMQIRFLYNRARSLWHAFSPPLVTCRSVQIPSLTELLRALLMLQFIRVISHRDPLDGGGEKERQRERGRRLRSEKSSVITRTRKEKERERRERERKSGETAGEK